MTHTESSVRFHDNTCCNTFFALLSRAKDVNNKNTSKFGQDVFYRLDYTHAKNHPKIFTPPPDYCCATLPRHYRFTQTKMPCTGPYGICQVRNDEKCLSDFFTGHSTAFWNRSRSSASRQTGDFGNMLSTLEALRTTCSRLTAGKCCRNTSRSHLAV
ncbi:unnamed protein product [Ectocarpus fasciculatus]